MVNIASLLERNRPAYCKVTVWKERGDPPPRTIIVTCCDPRCVPEHYFDIKPGEAIVHRNAGGNIRHALRDIIILNTLVKLDEIAIIHHTDCGMLRFTNEQIRTALKGRVEESRWAEVDEMDFGTSTDVLDSLKGDIKWVHDSPFLRDALKQNTQGFVFDLKSGKVEKVEKVNLV